MKYKLIYIIGSGFSGSTFLDMLLGSHDHVIGLGEMMFLPDYMIYKKKCTCGFGLKECSVWGRVLPEIGDHKMKYFTRDFHHDQYYAYLRTTEAYSESKNREYALYQFDMLRKIGALTNKRIFVDSSKNIPRLRLYVESCPDDFEIFAIHLIRDPLGHMNSSRHYYGASLTYPMAGYAWLRLNQLVFKYLKKQQIIFEVVFYKEACLNTLNVMNRIFQKFGIGQWNRLPDFLVEGKHNIEGNPTRFDFKNIYYDQTWKKEVPIIGKIFGTFLILPYLWFQIKGGFQKK